MDIDAESLAAVKRVVPSHRTLAEKAYTTLHEAIVTGVLKPGVRLPSEELAEMLEMSLIPTREAIARLASVGLVRNNPHHVARVTELSLNDLRGVYEARLALEPLAIHRAAARFTPEDAERSTRRLKEHVRAYRSGPVREMWATHTAFHFSLYEAADTEWVVRLVRPLWDTSERYRYATLPVRGRFESRRDEHERILQACLDHEPELAAAELYNHLAISAGSMAQQMGGEPPFELKDVDAAVAGATSAVAVCIADAPR